MFGIIASMLADTGRLLALVGAAACALGIVVAAQTTREPHPGQAPYDRVCKVCLSISPLTLPTCRVR